MSSLEKWAKETPYQIKSLAIKDACVAVKNAKKKCLETGQAQEVKYRSKKKRKDTIYIPKILVKENSFYRTLMGEIYFTEAIGEVKYDCKVMHHQGRYFLIKPEDKPIQKPENQRKNVVGLDPGVRVFQAFYSPEMCGLIGKDSFGRICRLCHYMDTLISRMSKVNAKKRYRIRKALDRMRWKIRDVIKEIHCKTANFLCKNYDVIAIPSFETSEMVVRSMRKIKSKTVRAMLTWSHYKFKVFLKHKCVLMSSTLFDDLSEAYTSKTCSACGFLDQNLGGKKIFKCKSCNIQIDRDFNGARGFFLRNYHVFGG